MRRILLALAATGAALAVASPASAQYYGQSYGYGYNGYGNGGYGNWGMAAELERRIDNVLRGLDGARYGAREQLWEEAISLKRQLRYAARNGLNPYEARAFDQRIGRLEQRKGWASGYGGYGENRYYGDHRGYGDHGYSRDHGDYGRGHGDRDRDDDD